MNVPIVAGVEAFKTSVGEIWWFVAIANCPYLSGSIMVRKLEVTEAFLYIDSIEFDDFA